MTTRNESEDLDDLLRHPGWVLVVRHAQTYWTDQIEQQLAMAVNDTNDALAAGKMRQVIAAKGAIKALIAWPQERIRQLEAGATSRTIEHTESRRGRL